MSIDSAKERRAALAARFGRLPFGRRFRNVAPDGTIDATDRAVLGGSFYSAVPPAAEVPVFVITPRREPDLALTRGQRQGTVRWELWDAGVYAVKGEIHPAVDSAPVIEVNGDRVVKRTVQGLIIPWHEQADVDTFADRVRPVFVFADGSEYRLGTFVFAAASRDRLGLEALDLHGSLMDTSVGLAYAAEAASGYPAGFRIRDAIVAELEAAQVEDYRVDFALDVLGGPVAWPAETTRLARINDLARLGRYYDLYSDNQGLITVRWAANEAIAAPTLHYGPGIDQARPYAGTIVENDDLLSAPNRWFVISSSATTAPVAGAYSLPVSWPHSFGRRGFHVTKAVRIAGLTSYTQAVEVARAEASKDLVQWSTVEFDAAPDPRHDTFDLVAWLGDNYLETGWRLEAHEGGAHHHSLRGAVA